MFKALYRLLIKFGAILGWINTRILLTVIFYGLFFPIGLIKRLQRDPLSRAFDRNTLTYRVLSPARPITDMEKPY